MLPSRSTLILLSLLLHQSLAISHPHSSTSSPPPPVRKEDPATTAATLPQVPANIRPSALSSGTEYENDSKVETNSEEKKVLGLFDDIPKNGTFKVKDEVENFFKDQINAKIADFEDLKKQIAVLDRHLKKHSEFADFNTTDHMLLDLDEKVIKPYEDGLKVLKNRIVEADHDNWSSTSVDMINDIVSKAEKFIDISYERVYGTLDDHLESDEHKNEHAHGHGHSEDHAADYADLITAEDETVDVSSEDEELLIEYIDMDINDLENIIKQKDNLEHHIEDHFKLDNVESDELQLVMAENVLQNLDIEKLKAYEKSLQDLKSQIKQSNGKLKLEMVDQVSATMEKAEVFLDASQEKLKLVGDLDEEFEVFEETEAQLEEFKPITEPNVNIDLKNVPVISNAIKKTTTKDKVNSKEESSAMARETYQGDSAVVLPGENPKQHEKAEKILIGEGFQLPLLPFHFSATLTILSIVVLVGMVGAAAYRMIHKAQVEKDLSCESGCASDKVGLVTKEMRSPQLEVVNEDDDWNSKKWAKTWAAEPSRRKRK